MKAWLVIWFSFLVIDLILYFIVSAKHGPLWQPWPGSGFYYFVKYWRKSP